MKKRLIAVLLSLVLLLGLLPLQSFAALDNLPTEAADADYDGIPDQYDPDPNGNSFTGSYKSGNFSVSLSYVMDYREFFGDNTGYNQTIADFSTWAAQFTYENEDNDTYYNPSVALRDSDGSSITRVTHIDQLMRAHGMENVIDYKLENGYSDSDVSLPAYSDDDVTEVYFGHHEVSYNGQTIEVVAVYVRGTNGTEKEWCSNFDVGDLNRYDDEFDCVEGKAPRQPNRDWSRKSNHRGFDVCSTRVRRALDAYMESFVDSEAEPVFWLTGHSRGGAISNITASYLIDAGHKVFAYTFASPNTTANTEASAAKYDCIFNLVNSDDFVPMLPMHEWGFTRYGRTASVYASSASSSQRSALLGSTSYNYSSDLQSLVNKFASMTVNNNGGNEGWRDVYVYHCHGGTDTDHDEVHLHEGETVGEFRSGSRKDYGSDNNWRNYNEHTKKYSYCVKDKDGGFLGLGNKWSCCQTPAYAMQLLAITMGNLGLSAGWSFLTSYDLASRFDFGKMNLITNYATKIIDPHYMENYYLIQKLSESQGNPDSAYTTGASLYTDGNGRPVHVHSYTLQPYADQLPTCTETGRGDRICNCSAINPAWYDDVIKDVEIPARGHTLRYEYLGASMHAAYCSRCEESFPGEPCSYEDNVCTVCGHAKAASRIVSVYVVDELNGSELFAWAWGDAGNLDSAWPGRALSARGSDKGGHPYYRIDLDLADYDQLILNRNGQPQTAALDIVSDAGANDYAVYYIYGVSGNDLQASQGTDLWPAPGVVTEPSCTEAGFTTYTGMFTGEPRIGNEIPALGHDYAAVVTAPTCTDAGFTTYTCSRCGDSYTADETEALGHQLGEPVQENYVEPTATEDGGYDTVVYCQRCNAELSREHTVLPATGPVEPIETSALHIYSSISVGTDMVVTLTIRKNDLTNYEKFWIEVVKHEPVNGDVTYVYEQDVLTENSATWTVQFNKIYATEMGLDVEARLYVEDAAGQVYMSPARNANIREHLGSRLTATNNIVEQRVLAADMLNYGAAAQLFMNYQTDHLVNEELTDEQLEKLHEYETKELPAADKTNSNTLPEGQSNILFNSMTLGNEVLLNLTVRLPENTENVQVKVTEHASGEYVKTMDVTWSGSTFQTTFSGIGADKMRTEYDFVTLVDGVETGNIRTWSVEGRVVEIRAGSNQLMTNVANALLTYGDSAAAYFAAQ